MSARLIAGLRVSALLFASGSFAAQPALDGSFHSAQRFMEKDGEAVFKNVCAACHMPNAQGVAGAARYPALAGNPKLASAAYAVFMVVNGRGAMPPLAQFLNDDQIAGVVNYVRTHFGNAYKDRVSSADVNAIR